MQRVKNASRNLVFGIILKCYQIVFPFIIRTIMIYTIGMNYVGLNTLFSSVLQVLNLVELGVGSAMVYSMYKPIVEEDEKTINALLNLYKKYYRIIGAVIFALGLVILPFVPQLISSDSVIPDGINVYVIYMITLITTVSSYWLFAYKGSLLIAYQRNDIISKVSIVTNTIEYLLQIVSLLIFKDYYLFLGSVFLFQIFTNMLTAFVAGKKYPRLQPRGNLPEDKVREVNQRVRDLFTSKIGMVVVNSVDSVVISIFLGLGSLAVYNNYYYVINAVASVILILFNSVVSGIGNSIVTENTQKNYMDFKVLTLIIHWILVFSCSGFVCMLEPFMKLWVGKENMLSNDIVILIIIFFYICQLTMLWTTYKDAAGIWHSDRFRPLLSAVMNLVLNIVLVQFIGLYGILLSTIISYLIVSIPWLIHNLFKIIFKRSSKEYILITLKYVMTSICVIIAEIIFCRYVTVNIYMDILIRGLLVVIFPNIIYFILFRKTEEFERIKCYCSHISEIWK